MNELEKKSYRYEVLAELARELGYKKEQIEDDINRWEDIEDEWSKKEVEKAKSGLRL